MKRRTRLVLLWGVVVPASALFGALLGILASTLPDLAQMSIVAGAAALIAWRLRASWRDDSDKGTP